MTQPLIRLLIQKKLAAGRLPYSNIPRLWGGPGSGETCDGCEEPVTKDQLVLENLDAEGMGIRLHVSCFHVWQVERHFHGAQNTSLTVHMAPPTS